MIEKSEYGDWDVTCDSCGRAIILGSGGEGWRGVARTIRRMGWQFRKVGDQWTHQCPECGREPSAEEDMSMRRGPSIENGQTIWWDPRPDLTGDSAAWSRLLTMASNTEGVPLFLVSCLDYFRTRGTRLRAQGGRLVLFGDPQAPLTWERQFEDWPQLPEAWRRKILAHEKDGVFCGWESVEEYRRERDQWLKPHAALLTGLLKRLEASAEGGMLLAAAGGQPGLDLGERRHDGKVSYA